MLLPRINDSGTFKFAAPYDKLTSSERIYTVVGIHTLGELIDRGDDPLNTIFKLAGLTESDYATAVKNKTLLVSFKSGSETFTIPVDRILSTGNIDGVKYIQRTILIPLGLVPEDMSLQNMLHATEQLTYDQLGISTKSKYMNTSDYTVVTPAKDILFRNMINGRRSISKSDKLKYQELYGEYIKLKESYDELVAWVTNNVT